MSDNCNPTKNYTNTNLVSTEPPVISHVMVIGFHHKKGSQVDFCYPPIKKPFSETEKKVSTDQNLDRPVSPSDEYEDSLPEEWKSLPNLALPDGAHNFSCDTVFFHLPSLNPPLTAAPATSHPSIMDQLFDQSLVYCVSCYKQVAVSDSLKEADSSVTRSTIIKAVVVVSRLPYYGLIAAKTESMTRVYFKQPNFKDKSCLIELYGNLNFVLSKEQREITSPLETSLLSLSPTKYLIPIFGHKILMLLKLLLLEKRVLIYLNLTSNPNQLPTLPNSPVTSYESFSITSEMGSGVKLLCMTLLTLSSLIPRTFSLHTRDYYLYCTHCTSVQQSPSQPFSSSPGANDPNTSNSNNTETAGDIDETNTKTTTTTTSSTCNKIEENRKSPSDPTSPSRSPEVTYSILSIPPIKLFKSPNECHPYACLSTLDQLHQLSGYMVGATNALFKAKKSSLFDVIIDLTTGKIEIENNDLKKLLSLTTEDLRFADFLLKHVTANTSLGHSNISTSSFYPGQSETDSFEGSDDWLRIQINLYLLHALRTSFLRDDCKDFSSFNSSFMKYWKEHTTNYKEWKEMFLTTILTESPEEKDLDVLIKSAFEKIQPGHPFSSSKTTNASSVMNDMKLRFINSYGSSLFAASPVSTSSISQSNILTPTQTGSSPRSKSPDASGSSRRTAVLEASKSAFNSAKSTLTSWLGPGYSYGERGSSKSSTDQSSDVNDSTGRSDFDQMSVESAHDVLAKELQSLSYSSLLKKVSDDDSSFESVSAEGPTGLST